jgi:hypothetical protein
LIKSGDLAINCENFDIQRWGIFSGRRCSLAGDGIRRSGRAPGFTKDNPSAGQRNFDKICKEAKFELPQIEPGHQ